MGSIFGGYLFLKFQRLKSGCWTDLMYIEKFSKNKFYGFGEGVGASVGEKGGRKICKIEEKNTFF